MEIGKDTNQVFSRLHFRMLAPVIPIVLLMVILGGAVFSFGMKTVSQLANAKIIEDLERNSRDIYTLCDTALQNLMLEGWANEAAVTRVRKGNTLGKIEDYAQQHDLQIIVYEGRSGKLLHHHTPAAPEAIIAALDAEGDKRVVKVSYQGSDYYASRFQFELWDWQIVVAKDGSQYAKFVNAISRSYLSIGAILLLVSMVLVVYFRHVIHTPIRSIIASIQKNGMPDYQGIYEFEFLSDVIRESKQKEQQKQIEMSHHAAHDELTGLMNRREFSRRLALVLESARSDGELHTILYLDLDQFKIINDTCGHHAGDALLQQLTRLMQDRLRHSDVLARLGGDEFGVLLENCSGAPALRVAELLRATASEFRFLWEDRIFSIGVSIGLVTFGDDGLALNDILSIVDGACYIAKDKGRNRIHVYQPGDGELRERKGQMNWVARISSAIEDNRMVLYRQKIVPLQPGADRIEHFEVLLRMIDEDGSLIPPMSFIPAAERYGLMSVIDFWVIKRAFEYYREVCTDPDVTYTCAINLSGATLGNERLPGYVREQFAACAIPPAGICFEITETAAIASLHSAAAFIRELRLLGCRFALDDFGSGMSSFGYLKNLPVDFIKIDGSFVQNMHTDRIDRAMVEAINNIGHEMGIQTIAEFVENDGIKELLRGLKVDFAQGYGVGRPELMTASDRKPHQHPAPAETV